MNWLTMLFVAAAIITGTGERGEHVATWTCGGHPINCYKPGACVGTFSGYAGDGEFGWPVPPAARRISGYVFRDARNPGHNGTDFGAWWGCPLYAADDGIVVFTGWWGQSGFGNLVIVDHLNGWQTWYAHLSWLAVVCGEQVWEGDVLGYAGSTGWSTGSHLHFEMRYGAVPMDPMKVLKLRGTR